MTFFQTMLSVVLGLVLALLALPGGSVAQQPEDLSPCSPRSLNGTASFPGYLGSPGLYCSSTGNYFPFLCEQVAAWVPPSAAIACLQSVQVNLSLAVQHVLALADNFEEYYTFAKIARDPPASSYSLPNNTFPFGITIWDQEKIDIVAELRDIAANMTAAGAASLFDIGNRVNTAVTTLRDTHVQSVKLTQAGMLSDLSVDLVWSHSVTNTSLFWASTFDLLTTGTEFYVKNRRTAEVVESIGGVSAIEWMAGIANSTTFTWKTKSLGSRFNSVYGMLFPGAPHLGTAKNVWPSLGLMDDMPDGPLDVVYTNGRAGDTIQWVVSFSKALENVTVGELNAQAAVLGTPFMALENGLAVFNGNPPPYPEAAAVPDASRRKLKEHVTPRVLQSADSGASYNGTNDGKIYGSPSSVEEGFPEIPGQYGIYYSSEDGSPYAVWKLQYFTMNATEYITKWNYLLDMAAEVNATRLLYDITGNGGGDVPTGYLAVACLYPFLSQNVSVLPGPDPNAWTNPYTRPVGPSATTLVSEGLLPFTGSSTPGSVFETIDQLLANQSFLAERAEYLTANPGGVTDALVNGTLALLEATEILVNGTTGLSKDFLPLIQEGIAQVQEVLVTQNYTVENLNNMFDIILQMIDNTGDGQDGTFSSLSSISAVFNDRQYIYIESGWTQNMRGGVNATETESIYIFFNSYFEDWATQNQDPALAAGIQRLMNSTGPPFTSILAVGDGKCGSTCDTFSGTAWELSKTFDELPPFRYVTFGGNGDPDAIYGTSFPGGNVNDNDILTPAWVYTGAMAVGQAWLNVSEVTDAILPLLSAFPMYSAYATNVLGSTQSQMYARYLGGIDGLPKEYLAIPTDFYIANWWSGAVDLASPYLPDIYEAAYAYFDVVEDEHGTV